MLDRLLNKRVRLKRYSIDENTERQHPTTLILQRYAIRALPNGQTVAFYRDARTNQVIMFPAQFSIAR